MEIIGRGVWQANVYEGVYFNDFVKANLVQNILKGVRMNGISGSSCPLKRFDRLCLTVIRDEFKSIGN